MKGPAGGTTSRTGLIAGLLVGVPIIAYGVRGVFVDAARTHPGELARWVVGGALVNDLVLVPAVIALGWAARRVVPAAAWPAVRTGLVTSGTLMLVAWPFVRGYGRDPANPSLLPRNYAGGLAAGLAAVWVGVALSLVVRWAQARRASKA